MTTRLPSVLVLACLSLTAQEFRATLQGTVTDPSKAAIVGADVTLRNTATSVERKGLSDNTGHYLFQFLPPGPYSLTIKAAGFKTEVRDGVSLSLGDNTRIDVELPVGQATEMVSVVGDVAAVQSESSSLGSVVRQEIIDTLPLKGHSSLFMFTLATGVVNNRYGEDTRPNDTITNVSYSSNGSPVASGDVSVDGVANTINVNRGVNISQWVPAVDAVAEFKLQTGTLPAEYGRAGGNIMNIVIKSGTNELHGSAYEFLRNAALDANLFFNNLRGAPLARYGSNTYGFSVGGPVWIPGAYNGKNRTFFFVNFEGSREGNGISPLLSVPTDRMRTGDFSEIATVIYNPLSVRSAGGVSTRDPFPGNIVPQAAQDPVGRNIMNFWPKANVTGPDRARPFVNNYAFSAKWPRDYDATVVKIDHHFSDKNLFFARVNKGEGRLVFPYRFEGVATGGRNNVKRPHVGVALNDTILLSDHTTLDVRLGAARGIENNRPWSDGFDPGSLGFSSSFVNLIQSKAFPNINVSDMEGLADSPYIFDPGYTWSLQPSLSLQRGRHLFKTGGDFRLLRGNYFRNLTPSGSFSFGPNQTGGPNAATPGAGTGFGLASMLVGFGSGSLPYNTGLSIQNVYYGLYFQDDFRVSSRLTLNLGLRWEYESPRTERYNRTTRGWAYNTASPLQVPGLSLRGGLLYAGVNGQERGIYNPDRNNFAPRIGFAYSVTKKLVLRGGYALSYIPVIGSVTADGYSNTTPWVSSTDGGITIKDRLSNPFPTGLLPPIGNSQGLATLLGQGVSFVEPADTYPRFHNWQFNIQRELPGQLLVEAAYVGTRGIGLIANTENLNQIDPQNLSMGAALTQTVANPFLGRLTGALGGATVQRLVLLRPYPQYTGVGRINPGYGNSVYHSIQLRVEKRLSHGVAALVSFTGSKNITDLSSPQNPYNRRLERAVGDFDVPQRLTIAAAWDLPFGKGRPHGGNAPRALDLLIGGWQLSTFSTFQGGFAQGFGVQGGNYAGFGVRPNVIGDPTAGVSGGHGERLGRYFNTDAFARPADFTLGNLGPRIASVRNPGMNNVNLTLSKDFRIVERIKLQFRASQFNLFNHPVFSGPNTTVGNASFGRISAQNNISRQTEFALRVIF
ncbi:MAG: TonB-dependent receptor [Candidatus Solibacter usitatus]|nr:TonB-dependent receptor [Candidatus Solibacter usitatus]